MSSTIKSTIISVLSEKLLTPTLVLLAFFPSILEGEICGGFSKISEGKIELDIYCTGFSSILLLLLG